MLRSFSINCMNHKWIIDHDYFLFWEITLTQSFDFTGSGLMIVDEDGDLDEDGGMDEDGDFLLKLP